MNYRILLIILIAGLIAINLSETRAQTIEETMRLADSLSVYSPDEALPYYKRVQYFSSNENISTITFKLGVTELRCGNFDEAISEFDWLERNTSDSTSQVYHLYKLTATLNAGYSQDIINETDSVYLIGMTPEQRSIAVGLRLLAAVSMKNFGEAFQCSNQLKKLQPEINIIAIDSILRTIERQKFPEPKKASLLSLIVPGLGQAYSSDYKNAANAFVLNYSLVGAFIYTGLTINWISASLFWVYYLPHFYLGNSKVAAQIAEKRADYLQNSYYNTLLAELSKTIKVTGNYLNQP